MNRVTITGADDQTPIQALVDLSAEFPFVEWGILVSAAQEGNSRFPSRDWCGRYAGQHPLSMQTSMHVCGRWVRRLLTGDMKMDEFPDISLAAGRIQINTHAEEHVSTVAGLEWMAGHEYYQFIFQLDGINDHVFDAGVARRMNVAGLFDKSHGAGVLPDAWPVPWCPFRSYGFAGGLGPDNVREELPKINESWMRYLDLTGPLPARWHPPDFWIDMEGQVRDESDRLDLGKVRRVLEICAPLISSDSEECGA